LEKAADLIKLDPDIARILAKPANEIETHFPVKMDDDRVEMFTGYRIQHSNALGPFLGGLRYHPAVSLEAMRIFAAKQAWQCAFVELPFGGSMGGIKLDPATHTLTELEQITRRFAFALGNNIGPEYDILSPDVNTNPQIMAWILDTFISTVPPHERQRCTHVVTGKPVEAGGSLGREKATGQGIVYLLERWAEDRAFVFDGASFILQGFGNVGSWVARLLHAKGAKLVAVEEITGAIASPDGLDPDDLLAHKRRHGFIYGYPKAHRVGRDDFLKTHADIFVAASLENQITAETAPLLDVKLVAEGANGPTDAEGEEILKAKGAEILPDIICNSGGPIVSYYEWLQNKRGDRWDLDEVDLRLHRQLMGAYDRMKEAANEFKTDWRTAAFALAAISLERIYKDRGIFP
jgi:glutamate dehydrogenase (NAD(P)+)